MKGEIVKINQFNKRTKKQLKEWESNWKKIAYHKLGLNDEIENKLKFNKRAKNKN